MVKYSCVEDEHPIQKPTPRKTISTQPKPKLNYYFNIQELTDLHTAVFHYLSTYKNPKRIPYIKEGGITDLRNKRMEILLERIDCAKVDVSKIK